MVWDFDEDTAAIGVLPTDNSLFINPMWWMNDTVNTDRATNFMLNYNMVTAHNVPPAARDEALGSTKGMSRSGGTQPANQDANTLRAASG